MKSLPAITVAALALLCLAPLVRADDAAKRSAAAEEMLKAMHVEDMLGKQKQNMLDMMSKMSGKDVSEDARKEMLQKESAVFDDLLNWDKLKPDFVQAYADVYTEDELKQLTAFYKSPIGQKYIEKMPELQKKTTALIQKRMMGALPMLQALHSQAKQATQSSSTTLSGTAPAPTAPAP